jgi:trehalose 6-phosphate phosphatase
MKILKPNLSLDLFLEQLSVSARRILLLDYDGTIAPFTEDRMMAYPYAGIEKLISKIRAIEGCRIIIISGRKIDHLLKLLSFDVMPELWGCHGWERLLPGGKYIAREPGSDVTSFLEKASQCAVNNGLTGRFERKPASIAFHWRGAGHEIENKITSMIHSHLLVSAMDAGMEMRQFSGGVELIVSGINKGRAVSLILDEQGKDAVVAYLGDDKTDEDAFAALGDHGLSVLVSPESRATRAGIWIRPPEELFAFLESWIEACEARL